MCRLVLMNKQGEKEIDKKYGLEKYFNYLEEQLGGHGNGYALMKDGKIIDYEKGVKLKVSTIANKIKNTDYDWAVFHTRFASMGEKNNKNCHPFIRKDFLLAMNGTESNVSFISNNLEMTDTEIILDLINKYKLPIKTLRNFHSIFIGFYKGKPLVVANNLSNIKILNNPKNKALVFASTFPEKFKTNIFEPTECFLWKGDKLPSNLKKYKKTYFKPRYYDSYIYNDYYGQYYWDEVKNGGKQNECSV